jgi:hypothetical protein
MLLSKNNDEMHVNSFLIRWVVLCMGIAGFLCSGGCTLDWTSILEDMLSDSTTSTTSDFSLSDMEGTWSGSLTVDSEAMDYDFVVDSSGSFVAGNGTTGTVTISSSGTVTFKYVYSDYTISFKGTMSSDKESIEMSTYSWTGTSSGSTSLTGTLSISESSTYLLTDLVGTWTGTLTENGSSSSYEFTVDSTGTLTINDSVSGTATITTSGTVIFTYSTDDYVGTFEGTMNSGKTAIVMSRHTWIGDTSGSTNFTGTLYN